MESMNPSHHEKFLMEEENLQGALQHVDNALENNRQYCAKAELSLRQHQEVLALLEDLPKKVSREIMVPFGPLAFFPGELIHTNEVFMNLGDGLHFAHRTAPNCKMTLIRRCEALKEALEAMNKQMQLLKEEHQLGRSLINEKDTTRTLSWTPDGYVEIREPYVDEEHEEIVNPEQVVKAERIVEKVTENNAPSNKDKREDAALPLVREKNIIEKQVTTDSARPNASRISIFKAQRMNSALQKQGDGES